ncbi:hypothetical protein TNCV_4359881 [Trichonephila clavipes]|uniref:Uncharacterized protein n=1 Tax=Trichonephila clavipes TaxID=2585209 RepID=A0A8X7BGR7_TRICX|nr:hypothetical protein TNCV_4359881 [Trichonephila clavipes]
MKRWLPQVGGRYKTRCLLWRVVAVASSESDDFSLIFLRVDGAITGQKVEFLLNSAKVTKEELSELTDCPASTEGVRIAFSRSHSLFFIPSTDWVPIEISGDLANLGDAIHFINSFIRAPSDSSEMI